MAEEALASQTSSQRRQTLGNSYNVNTDWFYPSLQPSYLKEEAEDQTHDVTEVQR